MNNITLYTTDYITVEYSPDHKLISHTIHQPILHELDMFKAALNAGTEGMEKYKVSRWLSDDRKNGQLSQEGLQWSFEDWQPRTIKAGWKYWANVVPHDLAAAGTLTPVIDKLYEFGLRMMVFTNVEEAVKWLDKLEG